jgi:hypothetical protein
MHISLNFNMASNSVISGKVNPYSHILNWLIFRSSNQQIFCMAFYYLASAMPRFTDNELLADFVTMPINILFNMLSKMTRC